MSAPATPTGLGVDTGASMAQAHWNLQGDALSYRLERRVTGTGYYKLLANTSSPIFFDVSGAVGVSYDYRLAGVNAEGMGAYQTVTGIVSQGPLTRAMRTVFIGDSISAFGAPTVPAIVGALLKECLELGTMTIVAQGASGTKASDWQPGGAFYPAAKAAAIAAGCDSGHIMLGINESQASIRVAKAAYKTQMQTIITDMLTYLTTVWVSKSHYTRPGAFSNAFDAYSDGLLLQYHDAIDEIIASSGGRVKLAAGKELYEFVKLRSAASFSDGIHPDDQAGYEAIATFIARGIAGKDWASYDEQIMRLPSLRSRKKLDGSAVDSVNTALNGTVTGAVELDGATGLPKGGRSALFTGGYITSPHNAAYANAAYSVIIHFRTSLLTRATLVHKLDSGTLQGWYISINSSGQPGTLDGTIACWFGPLDFDPWLFYIAGAGKLGDDKWHQIVLTCDNVAAKLRIYLDGSPLRSFWDTNQPISGLPLEIGRNNFDNTFATGVQMAEMAYLSEPLSPLQVMELWDASQRGGSGVGQYAISTRRSE